MRDFVKACFAVAINAANIITSSALIASGVPPIAGTILIGASAFAILWVLPEFIHDFRQELIEVAKKE